MPEITPATLDILRDQVRAHLLRAAAALADRGCDDAEALALTRNTAALVLEIVDTVAASPMIGETLAA